MGMPPSRWSPTSTRTTWTTTARHRPPSRTPSTASWADRPGWASCASTTTPRPGGHRPPCAPYGPGRRCHHGGRRPRGRPARPLGAGRPAGDHLRPDHRRGDRGGPDDRGDPWPPPRPQRRRGAGRGAAPSASTRPCCGRRWPPTAGVARRFEHRGGRGERDHGGRRLRPPPDRGPWRCSARRRDGRLAPGGGRVPAPPLQPDRSDQVADFANALGDWPMSWWPSPTCTASGERTAARASAACSW